MDNMKAPQERSQNISIAMLAMFHVSRWEMGETNYTSNAVSVILDIGRELDNAPAVPDHSCAESKFDQCKMAAFVSGIYWLHLCAVGEGGAT